MDESQKERIKYFKPECVDLLLSEFESNESIRGSFQFASKLSFNEQLRKMVARSLDLLSHDKIESFEMLGQRLKLEYRTTEVEEVDSVSDTLSDLIFMRLIQTALMEQKLLLKLDLDKSKAKPYEEVIDFSRSLSHNLKTSFTNQLTETETVSWQKRY